MSQDGLANGVIQGIEIDRQNPDIFWIATIGGFHRFDKSDESFTVYRHNPDDPTSLGADGTHDIIQDSKAPDILWIATANGFNRFDKKTGKLGCVPVFTHVESALFSVGFTWIKKIANIGRQILHHLVYLYMIFSSNLRPWRRIRISKPSSIC